MSTLESHDLSIKDGKGRLILSRVAIRVCDGDIVTIDGPSGSGKSSLLRVLAGLASPSGGSLRLDGVQVTQIPSNVYRRRVAYVPQRPAMLEGTVRDNLAAGAIFAGASADEGAGNELLRDLGLADFAGRTARELSGGEQHRVALVRALMNQPAVLLLDEPTAALDPQSAGMVLSLVKRLASNMAVCVVTHVPEHAAFLGGRALHVGEGELSADGDRP